MIPIKNHKEIEAMKEGGRLLRKILASLVAKVASGVKTIDLDRLAEELIKERGASASFKMVPGYHHATCITVNEEVVHGVPSQKKIKAGDVVSLDLGVYWKGFHTDSAVSLQVPGGRKNAGEFLEAGKRTLEKAIETAREGNFVGDISLTIEKEIKKSGFYPVRELTGHGVGRKLHEEPPIPCFLQGEKTKTPRLAPGMTLAIEVIYAQKPGKLAVAYDNWTVKAKNGKITGLFEKTVAVTCGSPLVLT